MGSFTSPPPPLDSLLNFSYCRNIYWFNYNFFLFCIFCLMITKNNPSLFLFFVYFYYLWLPSDEWARSKQQWTTTSFKYKYSPFHNSLLFHIVRVYWKMIDNIEMVCIKSWTVDFKKLINKPENNNICLNYVYFWYFKKNLLSSFDSLLYTLRNSKEML